MEQDDEIEWERRKAIESRVRRFVHAHDRLDMALAVLVAVLAWVLLTAFPYPILHPQTWGLAAMASGVRPPVSAESGLWMFLAHRVFLGFGIEDGIMALTRLGHVTGAVLAGLAYLLMRGAFSARLSVTRTELATLSLRLRLLAVAGSLVLCCSEAFWRLSQFFSDGLLCLLLATLAILSFERFRWHRSRIWYCICCFLTGTLVGETPVGVVLALAFFGWNWWERKQYWARTQSLQVLVTPKSDGQKVTADRKGRTAVVFNEKKADDPVGFFEEELSDAVKLASVRLENGLLFFFFSAGLIGVLVVGFRTFSVLGGLDAAEMDGWNYPLAFFLSWFRTTYPILRLDHLFFASVFSLFPFAVAYLALPRSTDSKDRFAVPIVIMLSLLGCAVWTQLGPVARFWCWTWDLVRSQPLPDTVRAVLAFFGAATLMASLQVLCCVCRKRSEESHAITVAEGRGLFIVRLIGKGLLVSAIVLMVVLSVRGRIQPSVCGKMELIAAYVKEFVSQTKGLDCVFTDGVFDDAFAHEQASRGERQPHLLSMMSGRDSYPASLRARAAKDDEDLRVLKVGAFETLRFWATERKERLSRLAMQVGHEVLVKCHVDNGRSAGLALRIGALEDAVEFDRYDAAAESLGERALAVAGGSASMLDGFDAVVSEKFDFMLWRLARMTDLRVSQCLLRDDGAGVVRQRELANRLDEVNEPYRKLRRKMEWHRPVESVVLSPREGLALALKRADFNLAYRYANRVLKDDPDDLNANFAMGMWAAETRQYGIALIYLEAANSKRPDEPSILNNLAMVRFKLGQLEEALRIISRAAEVNPRSEEIQRNMKQIREAFGRRK